MIGEGAITFSSNELGKKGKKLQSLPYRRRLKLSTLFIFLETRYMMQNTPLGRGSVREYPGLWHSVTLKDGESTWWNIRRFEIRKQDFQYYGGAQSVPPVPFKWVQFRK